MNEPRARASIHAAALLILCVALLALPRSAAAQPDHEVREQEEAVRAFNAAVQEYVALHRRLDPIAPPLHANLAASQISAHRQQLARLIAQARRKAKPGDIFDSHVRELLRERVRAAYPGPAGRDLRRVVMEEAPTRVAWRVNAHYPEELGASMMPPMLLAALPPLPEELEYRMVGRHLVLRDVEAELIVDFMRNAIP